MQDQFVSFKLLEDYLDIPYAVPADLVWIARCRDPAYREKVAQILKTTVNQLDNVYHANITFILHEMMIDPDHIGRKLEAAAARDGHPGNDIQALIDRCEWAALASTLVKDRLLLDKVFEMDDPSEFIQRISARMDRLQKKYFDNLTSPGSFVISSRAGALSAKAAKKNVVTSPVVGDSRPYTDVADDEG